MTNKKKLTKERAIILVAGVLVLMGGAWYRFAPDLLSFSNLDQVKAISKYQDRAALLPSLRERSSLLMSECEKLSVQLISAESYEIAGVAVQTMLRNITSQEQIAINSLTALTPNEKKYQFITVIPVRIAFKSTVRQLTHVLYQIREQSKFLSVDELKVSKPNNKGEDLNVLMTVHGFSKKNNSNT